MKHFKHFKRLSGGGKRDEVNVVRFAGIQKIRKIAGFARDERGSFAIFGLISFVGMMAGAGMAVDFMRIESERTILQSTLDRAVLAAASLNQTLDPETVVLDYFARSQLDNYEIDIDVNDAFGLRSVEVFASTTVDSLFLNMIGISELNASATGMALEGAKNVEVSLVLDMSGSMAWSGKMANLQSAATNFVSTVLGAADDDAVSISVIPYNAMVNAGETLISHYNFDRVHGFSHCVDFDDADYASTSLSTTASLEQGQHYEYSSSYSNPITEPYCPASTQSYEGEDNGDSSYAILPLSQNETEINAHINGLPAFGGTGIHSGMKWASVLLDPDSRDVVTDLILAGDVDAGFAGRPLAFESNDVLKIIVLMTDGEPSAQYRIEDWAYDSTSEYAHWNSVSLWRYLYSYVYSSYWGYYYDLKSTSSEVSNLTLDACDAAKDEGIIVYTIGFETNSTADDLMSACASSPSYFFDVDGDEIDYAFDSISSSIQKLQLTEGS